MNAPANNQPTLKNLSSDALHALGPTTIIGRHEDCNLVLQSERGASRKHARITVEKGVAILMDLGSLNGTLVNGREISRAVQLADGDLIVFDEQTFQFNNPLSDVQSGADNVTVIANKDEIGRPERIQPAIRRLEPNAGSLEQTDTTDSFDETKSWNPPQTNSSPLVEPVFPATSRPGGDAPTPRRLQHKQQSQQPSLHHSADASKSATNIKWSRWFIIVPLLILFLLVAFYFAYTAGLAVGTEPGSVDS